MTSFLDRLTNLLPEKMKIGMDKMKNVAAKKQEEVTNAILDKGKNMLADVDKPDATITEVYVKGLGFDGIRLLAKVKVSNPYLLPIPMCEIKYSLKSANREIAFGMIPYQGSLKASDETMLDVPVKVPHNALVSLVRDICGDWDIDYKLDLELIIDLPLFGNFTISLSYHGVMKLPTLCDKCKGKSAKSSGCTPGKVLPTGFRCSNTCVQLNVRMKKK